MSVLTMRKSNSKVKDFILGDSVYVDDTAALFNSSESLAVDAPRVNTYSLGGVRYRDPRSNRALPDKA